jgi:uncharacterized protein (DUF362 family)
MGDIDSLDGGDMPTKVVVSYPNVRRGDVGKNEVGSMLQRLLGGSQDSPFSRLVGRGGTVVIKPNMVRHFNPSGSLEAVVTSPYVCRVLIELAAEAVGPEGKVVVADSPQNDCDFDELLLSAGWKDVLEDCRARLSPQIEVRDLRPESVTMKDGVIVARHKLPGDPLGQKLINLGSRSSFEGSGLDPARLRGSDYDPSVTASSHSDGSHSYSICRTFLEADLLIVVPKVKTHKKVGVSLAMKNLVGLVGEKNRLPHHTAGFAGSGGDEYPSPTLWPRVRQWSTQKARPLLAAGRGVPIFRMARRFETAFLPEVAERSGNWWGNNTAWRMVVDLVRILREERLDAGKPTLFVYDGLVSGEGAGPLAPNAVDLGLLAAAEDPVAGDWVVTREMGMVPDRIPLMREAAALKLWSEDPLLPEVVYLTEASKKRQLVPHPGWLKAPAV